MAEKYRPSNGTEGECFIAAWCDRCEHERLHRETEGNADGCSILTRTMVYEVDEAKYPVEWIIDAEGPKCTAFVPSGEALPAPRCTKTPDMFEGPA